MEPRHGIVGWVARRTRERLPEASSSGLAKRMLALATAQPVRKCRRQKCRTRH